MHIPSITLGEWREGCLEKIRRFWRSMAVLPLAYMVFGCGGSIEGVSSPGPHGEGSIPIGRAKGHAGRALIVDIRFPDGSHLYAEPAQNGVVSVPSSIPDGPWLITVSQDASDHTLVFEDDPKGHKSYVFDVALLPIGRQSDVTGVFSASTRVCTCPSGPRSTQTDDLGVEHERPDAVLLDNGWCGGDVTRREFHRFCPGEPGKSGSTCWGSRTRSPSSLCRSGFGG